MCLSTAVFCPNLIPGMGSFVCFAATSTAEPRLGGGGDVQGSQALDGRQLRRAVLGGGGEDPRPPEAQALNEELEGKWHQAVFVRVHS